ncbi:MAG: hypothetical protein L3K26_00495 [Candidatus Hydrogenedentes bacterium]|nr:hypothetical protein [Candidatus Hydrogenedentota bacterium]
MSKSLTGDQTANGGTLSPAVGIPHTYDVGTVVDLVATAASGWRFKEWTGGKTGTVSSTTINMTGDKSVTGHFVEQHTVTTAVHTSGDVAPVGGTFDHGQSVSFTWDREDRTRFDHWEGLPDSFTTAKWGDGTSTNETVSFSIDKNYHLDAYDEDEIVTLTTSVNAAGCVGCTASPAPPKEYVKNDTGTATATAGTGWVFNRWTGNVPTEDEENNPLYLTMDGNKSVTAVFGVKLTVSKTGEGQVTASPGGGLQTPTFSEIYAQGTGVTLTPSPTPGWGFKEWTGDVPAGMETADPLNLTMDAAKTVRAVFAQVDLDVLMTGEGTVTATPPGGAQTPPFTETYGIHESVSLTPTPEDCWVFDKWEGTGVPVGEEESNPLTLPMHENTSVKAVVFGPEAELVSVTFTSDHGMLYDNVSDYEHDGNPVLEPEWSSSGSNSPISHTMNTAIEAELLVDFVSPSGCTFSVTGTGSTLTFSGTGFTAGVGTTVEVQSNELLPNQIDIVNETISWQIEFGGGGSPISLGSTGAHKIFVTYGPNTALDTDAPFPIWPGDRTTAAATIKRMEFLCDAARGKGPDGLDPIVAAGVVSEAIWARHGKTPSDWVQVAGGLWKALDDGKFECEAGRHLGACGMLMLGTSRSDIQQSYAQGCHAYPSTDTNSGVGYNSDCTDYETNYDIFVGTYELILQGNGPMENIFKIRSPIGDWWYIAVAPYKGPVLGSGGTGDALDKRGRYGIMIDPPVYGQQWRLLVPPGTIVAAPPLP